jgi:ABC-type Mn2+/Zn2+ transport system permease subunit
MTAMAHIPILADSEVLANTLRVAVATAALGVAAAVLSVFVVLRHWAYLGEGIAHAGFGGVGTAVLLAIAFPTLNDPLPIFLIGAGFALVTAIGVGWISRRRAVSGDTAVGIFVAAALAWGLIAFAINRHLGRGGAIGWENYLTGNIYMLPAATTVLAGALAAAILIVLFVLRRQVVLYCFDPTLAEVTGVPVGFVHYLLILLVGLVIIGTMQVIGMFLVAAPLVLPGAAGLAMSRKLKVVVAIAVVSNVVATLVGISVNWHWRFIDSGPAIVGVLFLEFLIAYVLKPRFREI